MGFSVSEFSDRHSFEIETVSYAGRPTSHSAMYIAKKVEKLVENLRSVEGCLVFTEDTIEVPEELKEKNVFFMTPAPQRDYALFVSRMDAELAKKERERKFTLTPEGYYVGENVSIGENCFIEPGVVIGHDVVIGNNALIRSGARIMHTVIGNDFVAGENCAIGTNGFTMAEGEDGNYIRIPTLGGVIIGDQVEVSALTNVSRGSAGNTILEDHVKIDSLVHIGHDAHLHKNVRLPAGVIVGGFDELMERSYVGINAVLRNRIQIGEEVTVGMGSVVTKSYTEKGITVVGNPAKPFTKK